MTIFKESFMKMKKYYYSMLGICIFGLTACGGQSTENKTDDTIKDATETVDSVTSVATDTVPAQTETVEVNPEEVLTLTVEKKNLKQVPEGSYKKGSWTVSVTNNGTSEVKGTDYVVAYSEVIEDSNADGFFYATKKRKAEGKDVAPGKSVQIELKSKGYTQEFKNPQIKSVK